MGEQLRNTAGTIIEGDEISIYLDPGPGSLVHCKGYDKTRFEGLIVTHGHVDHYNDAEPLIELISLIEDNPCNLLAPETVLNGYGDVQQSVSNYHQEMCTNVVNMSNNDTVEVSGMKIERQEMFHSEPKCIGFKISEDDQKIGFWSDTKFVDELTEFYEDCDVIVINCFFPRDVNSRKHTTVKDVPKILENSKASTAIITHFGKTFLESDLDKEKAWLEDQVDQKVIFADDGMTFPGDRKLSSF